MTPRDRSHRGAADRRAEHEAATLARLAPFAGLPRSTLGAIAARMRVQVVPAGAAIIAEGDEAGPVHVVLSGRVEVALALADGRSVRLHEAGPGAVLGEMAALDGGGRSAAAAALGTCRVGTIPRRAFLDLLETEPGFALALLREAAARTRRQNRRAAEGVTLDARGRLAAELLRVSGGAFRLDPPPRQRDLAAAIGVRRETVVREFGRLSRDGVLRRDDGALLLDVARLADLAREPELEGGS